MHIKLLSAAFLAITQGSDLAGAQSQGLGTKKQRVETKPLHGPLSTLVSLSLSPSLAVFPAIVVRFSDPRCVVFYLPSASVG